MSWAMWLLCLMLAVMAVFLVIVLGLNWNNTSKIIRLDIAQRSMKIDGREYPSPALCYFAANVVNRSRINRDKIRFRIAVDDDVTVKRFNEILGYLGESGIGRCEAHAVGTPEFLAEIYLPGSGHDFYYNIIGFNEKEKERRNIDDFFSLGDGPLKVKYVWIYIDKHIRMCGKQYDSWRDFARDVPKSGKIMYSVNASEGASMKLVIEIMAMLQQIPDAQVAFIPFVISK